MNPKEWCCPNLTEKEVCMRSKDKDCPQRVIEIEIIDSLKIVYNSIQWNIYITKKEILKHPINNVKPDEYKFLLKELCTATIIDELEEKINNHMTNAVMKHFDTDYNLRRLKGLVDNLRSFRLNVIKLATDLQERKITFKDIK